MLQVQETFFRRDPLFEEARTLPADIYNLAHTILSKSADDCVFVPLRAMQCLLALDQDEFVFVDSERRPYIDLAWQKFRSTERDSIQAPVSFIAVFYSTEAVPMMQRLYSELPRALEQAYKRVQPDAPGQVIGLKDWKENRS